MSNLQQQKCATCRTGEPGVSEAKQAELIKQLNGWEILDEEGVLQLSKAYDFPDFMAARDFANEVAELAEKEGHHPALLIEWGRVTVRWWTHKISGLHYNDFIMASKTDIIPK